MKEDAQNEKQELTAVEKQRRVSQISLSELREKVAEQYGYCLGKHGCDKGERQYGASDDAIIDLIYKILVTRKSG